MVSGIENAKRSLQGVTAVAEKREEAEVAKDLELLAKIRKTAAISVSALAKIFKRKSGVLENLKEQTLGEISGMHGNHKGLSRRMLENQMRTSLPGPAIPLTQEETNELAGGNHSIQGERDCLSIDSAGCRNGLTFFAAMLDVEAHGFQDALLGLFDGLAQAVDAREVIAVSVITLAFAFDGNWVAIEGHLNLSLS